MAHSHRVEQSVFVGAVVGVLIPAVLSIAGGAHVLRVVLPMDMGALSDFHYLL